MDTVTTKIYRRRTWVHLIGLGRMLPNETKWDWQARTSNGNIVASSAGQGYNNRADCIGMALKFSPPGSRVVDEAGVVVREGRSEA